MVNQRVLQYDRFSQGGKDAQFLQVVVCKVVARPLRHGIELYTMGEFHVASLQQLLELPLPTGTIVGRFEDYAVRGRWWV